jgi:phosphopantetheinyl transferase
VILPDHIDYLEVTESSGLVKRAEGSLSVEERARRAGFGSEFRRRSFTMGRFAARTLLARPLGCTPKEVPIAVCDDGSLDVPGSALQLSIAHSGAYAAAAVAEHEVGLDLEVIRPRSESVFRFVLHPDESSLRQTIDLPQDHQLVLFWALKEAVLKGKRTGLRRSPRSLRLEIDLDTRTATIRGRRTWSAKFDLRPDHVVAVAWPVSGD